MRDPDRQRTGGRQRGWDQILVEEQDVLRGRALVGADLTGGKVFIRDSFTLQLFKFFVRLD